ncbi:hypothetical protein AB1Y20_002575 [Prymnesium parvum]|uniref:Uncharacterized protein n=1 Tax=Prymnesium parvum TaxID=97485 RepID=A0AB34J8Z0_PRYPA
MVCASAYAEDALSFLPASLPCESASEEPPLHLDFEAAAAPPPVDEEELVPSMRRPRALREEEESALVPRPRHRLDVQSFHAVRRARPPACLLPGLGECGAGTVLTSRSTLRTPAPRRRRRAASSFAA